MRKKIKIISVEKRIYEEFKERIAQLTQYVNKS